MPTTNGNPRGKAADSAHKNVIVPLEVRADTYQSAAVADGLWNQAQTICGAIARARTKSSEPVKTIGVTSCYRQEGVSTVAAVLGLAAACQRRVLLVDANLSHSSVHQRFRVPPTPGMLQAVYGQRTANNCIQTSPLGISVVPAGSGVGPVTSYLRSDLTFPVLQSFTFDFDLVLVDLPAISDDASALELASLLDAVVLVVEAERVHRQAAQRTVARFQQTGIHVLGAVLNKRRNYTPDWLYRVL